MPTATSCCTASSIEWDNQHRCIAQYLAAPPLYKSQGPTLQSIWTNPYRVWQPVDVYRLAAPPLSEPLKPNLAVGGLTLYDDLEQHIDQQTRGHNSTVKCVECWRSQEPRLSLSYARGRQGIEESGAREKNHPAEMPPSVLDAYRSPCQAIWGGVLTKIRFPGTTWVKTSIPWNHLGKSTRAKIGYSIGAICIIRTCI